MLEQIEGFKVMTLDCDKNGMIKSDDEPVDILLIDIGLFMDNNNLIADELSGSMSLPLLGCRQVSRWAWSSRCQLADAGDLPVGQRVGQHQPDQSIQVATRFGITQVGHALAAQAETTVGIGAGRDRQDQRPLQGGDADFTARHRRKEVHWHVDVQIIAGPLEGVMGQDPDDQIQVSGRAAVAALLRPTG